MKSLVIAFLIATTTAAGGAAYISMERSGEALDRLARQEVVLADLHTLTEKLEARLAEAESKSSVTNWVIEGDAGATADTAPSGALRPSDEAIAYQGSSDVDAGPDAAVTNRAERVLVAGGEGDSAVAKSEMKKLLSEIRDEEEEQERARRQDRRMERLHRRIASYSERLHLQPSQEEDMVAVMTESMESRSELFQQMREGTVDRSEVRTLMQQNRDEANAEMQLILTSDQYDEYLKIQEEEQQSRGDRGGRGWRTPTTPSTGNGNSSNSNNGGSDSATDRRAGGGQ